MFVFGTGSLYYQSEMNKIWDHYGNPQEGSAVQVTLSQPQAIGYQQQAIGYDAQQGYQQQGYQQQQQPGYPQQQQPGYPQQGNYPGQ